MMRLTRPVPGAAAACLASALLAGCAVSPPASVPGIVAGTAFSRSGVQTPATDWWTEFDDVELDALVTQALQGNFSLRSTWQRLAAARAVVRRAGAARFPSVDAALTAGSNDSSQNNAASLEAVYEVDLWGRVASETASAEFSYLATREDLQTAAISLAAQVSVTWYRWLEQHSQLTLLDQQLKTNQQILDLIRLRFVGGQVRSADIARQQQLVESVRADQIVARGDLAVLDHQLAVLVGRAPNQSLVLPVHKLPELPPLPATGVPAALLQRRPDLRAIFYQIEAADQDVAVAVAERFPRLSLTAGVATGSDRFADVFSGWASRLVANLAGPVFDAGARAAEVARRQAVAAGLVNDYAQRALEAIGEVEDALALERQQQDLRASLDKQLKLARDALDRTGAYYTKGATDYLDVLDALRSVQTLERQRLVARRSAIEQRIALYRAVAGSLTTPDTPGASYDRAQTDE